MLCERSWLRGFSAELSQHFMKGPKCPTDTSALVPNCLGSEVSRVRSVRTPMRVEDHFARICADRDVM